MSKPIRTIIVDDEPLACERISILLDDDEEVEVIKTCTDGNEAIKCINNESPGLVFLDVQMPEVNGFDVLNKINRNNFPVIVFVTAYDEYAVKAFEVNAVDYLLKPFKTDRFRETLKRAKKVISDSNKKELSKNVKNLIDSLNNEGEYLQRLMVKSSDRYFFIKTEDIEWIESDGNYLRIYSGDKNYLIRGTLINMEKSLDPKVFFRVHRSVIINVNEVKELKKWFNGDYKIIMKNGKELSMSRNYKSLMQQF